MRRIALKRIVLRLSIVGLLLLSTVAFRPTDLRAQTTFAVNSGTDATDANPGNGVCETAPGNGICTLRAAIQESNALAGADSITLPAGTYILSIAGVAEDASATGDLDIIGDLTINGAGSSTTIIDGAGLDRLIDVSAAAHVTIADITLRNAKIGGEAGAGIRTSGTLALIRSAVIGNTAIEGGGIANTGVLTISDTSVSGNTATGDVYSSAGGIANDGIATISRTIVSNNTAVLDGGGIANAYAYSPTVPNSVHLELTDVTVDNNRAGVSGGGVANNGDLIVTKSTVNDNTTGSNGGGLFSFIPMTLTNVTVTNNRGGTVGGGVYSNGIVALTNVTISHNVLTGNNPVGAGIQSNGAIVKNTIVANNIGQSDCQIVIGFQTLGHNLDSGVSCNFTGPGDQSSTDPLLGPLQNNGGFTRTRALSASSPAIDAGDNVGCPATDQRGTARPVDGNGDGAPICDIGAYEADSVTLTPTPTSTSTPTPTPLASRTPTPTTTPSGTSTSVPSPSATAVGTVTPSPQVSPTPPAPLPKPKPKRALITVVQRPAPNIGSKPGGMVTYTVVATNRGKGDATNVRITIPFDATEVQLFDVNMSREGVWVSGILSDSLEIQTGPIGRNGDVVTATIRLRTLPNATDNVPLGERLSYTWSDKRSGGSGRSNLPVLVVADDDEYEPIYQLKSTNHLLSGSEGQATITFSTAIFAPHEPIAFWYNTPDGKAKEVGLVYADVDGRVRLDFPLKQLEAGWYSMVAHGLWTEFTAVGVFQRT